MEAASKLLDPGDVPVVLFSVNEVPPYAMSPDSSPCGFFLTIEPPAFKAYGIYTYFF
jgi:hypothetical protein